MGVKFFSSLLFISLLIFSLAYAKNETDDLKVIIKFKDPDSLEKLNVDHEDKLDIKKEEISEYRGGILERLDLDISHEFNLTNSVIAYVNETELKKLKKSKYIESIFEDIPVYAFMDSSNDIISSDSFWNLSLNEIKVNGTGETVCIIDTGIDYTHPAFTACNIINETRRGNTVSHVNESMHPYIDNLNQVFRINKTGFERIAVHFVNISTESEWDFVKVLDSENNTVAMYTGFMEDVWSPSINGDTLYVRLETDDSISGWGFKIDMVINGSVNTTLNWTTCEKVIGGWDFTGNQNNLDDQDPRDDEGHGTHVSGIISSVNATYRGVAPGSRILSVKALDETGGGNTTDVLAAMEFCIENKRRYNISVISLSLGSGSYSSNCDSNGGVFGLFSSLVNDAISEGIMVVAASGNGASSTGIAFPACLQNVTSVGATTKADNVDTSYSNSNSYLDLLAPGTGINSVNIGGGFVSSTGTSMAAPHVSGAALLLRNFKKLENGTILAPWQIEYYLKASGNNKTDSRNNVRTERINLTRALEMIDDIPRITYTDITTGNISRNFSNINITTSEPVSNAIIFFDNLNYTMIGSSKEFYFRINLTDSHNYTIYINDSTGNKVYNGSYFIAVDLDPPTINITAPVNNSVINISHQINLSLFSSDNTNCEYFILNESYEITENANFSIYENGQKNLTVNCTDLSDNLASSKIYFIINDTGAPEKSSFSVTSTTSSITFSYSTDEPSNATVLGSNSLFSKSHSIVISGLTANTNYGYNLTICDRLGNCNTTSGSKSTAAASSGGGGGGSSGGSSGGTGYTRVVKEIKPDFGDTAIENTNFKGKIAFKSIILPEEISSPGLYFQTFEITANESKETEFTFKVLKAWIEENKIEEVVLVRYNGTWTELPTIFSYSNETYNFYNSTTPGFSYFAIIGKKSEIKKNETPRLETFEEKIIMNETKTNIEPKKKKISFLSVAIILVFISILIVGFYKHEYCRSNKSNKK